MLARTESSLLLTTFHLVTIFPQYRAPVAGQPEAAPFDPCCSCTVYWTPGACLKLASHMTWWGDSRSPCWFRLNILKLIQKWQDSSSSFGRDFTGKFLSNLCLCAKAYVLYADRANGHVCLSSELGSVWGDMRVPVCLSACFCGLENPRAVPQLSLIKFRAP